MTSYKNIKVSVVEQYPSILLVQIDRAHKRNAVNRETADELYQVFKERFENDKQLSVAILTSSDSTSSFCAGADLEIISAGKVDEMNRLEENSDRGPMGVTRLFLSKPVIAAVSEGYCVAGGLELALWCDLRICTENSIFGVFCRRFGVPLIDGGTIRLPRLIGQSRALDLILTGRPVGSSEALQIGLVNRVVKSAKELLPTAIELARLISTFPQECMRSDRRSLYEQHHMNIDQAIKNEFQLGYKSLMNEGKVGSNLFIKDRIGRHGKQPIIDSKL
ncbi:putative enoyl CoA-hydratase [Tieghemostelium lacteum]|uniref:Putative enoyl CoA-hydratase n=1 Tax=Tieghemostelium lacteum TaxID=361077 RepID=A0A152A3G8_TIELA|nr:putative enoyl CoA-hydratase [Tieghemostelium lacteum]|eukprot:KYR00744.1 putative enoyl CoA-hydratase [Tieghemostelium lacteum]